MQLLKITSEAYYIGSFKMRSLAFSFMVIGSGITLLGSHIKNSMFKGPSNLIINYFNLNCDSIQWMIYYSTIKSVST